MGAVYTRYFSRRFARVAPPCILLQCTESGVIGPRTSLSVYTQEAGRYIDWSREGGAACAMPDDIIDPSL
jgi:hypothetical protein